MKRDFSMDLHLAERAALLAAESLQNVIFNHAHGIDPEGELANAERNLAKALQSIATFRAVLKTQMEAA